MRQERSESARERRIEAINNSNDDVLVAEVGGMHMKPGQGPTVGRGGQEEDVRAKVVPSSLTQLTPSTRHTRFDGHAVTCK